MNLANLADTPGYYYAIAYWLACMLFISQLNKRIKGPALWSMQYENYQMAEKSIEIVNQKYHDLKHQI